MASTAGPKLGGAPVRPAAGAPLALKTIVAHYGPLAKDHKLYLGSDYNVLLELDGGGGTGRGCRRRFATKPLRTVVRSDLEKVLRYSVDLGLLEVDRWTECLPRRVREQIPRVLRPPPPPSHSQRRGLEHCRAIARAVRSSFNECCCESNTDESCRVIRDGVCEIFLDAEGMGTRCYEEIVQSNLEVFRRCLGPQLKHKRRRFNPPEENRQRVANGAASPSSESPKVREVETADPEKNAQDLARQSIESIKDFAISTARQDPRLRTTATPGDAGSGASCEEDPDGVGGVSVGRYLFGNVSLLASRAKTAAQFRHVDAFRHGLQMVMALQPRSPPTTTYLVPDRLDRPEDVVQLWKDLATDPHSRSASLCASDGATRDRARPIRRRRQQPGEDFLEALEEVSDNVLRAMKADETIVFWIRHFGRVLCRPHRMVETRIACGRDPSHPAGSWGAGFVLCLPGGTVHGAPRSPRFRAVLFLTATPAGRPRYRASDQFAGPTLAASVAHRVWDVEGIGERERRFLEAALRRCVGEDPSDPSVDFASYLEEEIGARHEIGEVLRDAQDGKQAARRAPSSSPGGLPKRRAPNCRTCEAAPDQH